MNKDDIAEQLNDLIFSGDYDLDDLQDIIGDGDLAEYIQGAIFYDTRATPPLTAQLAPIEGINQGLWGNDNARDDNSNAHF